jgi:hypothetical protein
MHSHVAVIALLGVLAPLTSAECCTIDDPIGPFRTCSPLVTAADTPFLVKAINYTRYHDDLGGGRFDPDERWDSVTVFLTRNSDRVCASDETFCATNGPVCKLIDCLPMSQDETRATNNGGTLITDFVVSIPAGAGPDGAYYDLASSLFSRHDGSKNFSQSVWRTIPYANNASSLQYDNNWIGFNMTGMQKLNGTGDSGFFPFEVADSDSWPSFDLHKVPCRAFACTRSCVNDASASGTLDVKQATACIDECEGVDDVVNYCPDVGGTALTITPQDAGLGSQAALDAYVPNGCARYEDAAFPEAHASYVASVSAARASSTSATASAAPATASSGAIGARGAGAVLGIIPIVVVKVIFATSWSCQFAMS